MHSSRLQFLFRRCKILSCTKVLHYNSEEQRPTKTFKSCIDAIFQCPIKNGDNTARITYCVQCIEYFGDSLRGINVSAQHTCVLCGMYERQKSNTLRCIEFTKWSQHKKLEPFQLPVDYNDLKQPVNNDIEISLIWLSWAILYQWKEPTKLKVEGSLGSHYAIAEWNDYGIRYVAWQTNR